MIINCSFRKILSQFAIIFRKIKTRTSTYGIRYSPKDKKFAFLVSKFLVFHSKVRSRRIKLDQTGSSWINFDRTGSTLIKLDQIGSNWIKLDQIGSNLIKLDQIGIKWIKLDQIGIIWIKLDQI